MAFSNEAEVYEAMGLEAPAAEEPAKEIAEQTANETPEDRQEQVEAPDGEEGAQEQPEGGEGAGQAEDPLEKLRRELTEQHQAELQRQKADFEKRADEQVKAMGFRNPYDGNKPIETVSEYEAYQKAHQEATWGRISKQTGMSQEELDKLITEHPEVRKALEVQAQAQEAQKAAEQRQLQQKLNDDIAAIAAECPEVTDLETLVNHPSYAQVEATMRKYKGMGVADAFFLVNRTSLAAGKATAEGQRVRNNMAGKNHLRQTGSRGNGATTMSREQENMYRRLLPGASRDEILKFHQDNMKGA